MDRGIPTEEILQEMRDPAREMFYLVGTPKGKIQEYEKKWLDLPWQKIRESVRVNCLSRTANSMCWPGAKEEEPEKPPCGANVWLVCSKSFVLCGEAYPRAISY
jgi:hypothetical protein